MSSKISNIKAPFIETSPIKDVYFMILFIPLWWVLGVEQLIYSVILTIALAKTYFKKKTLKADITIVLFLLFMIVYVISSFYITDSYRILTFFRNFGSYYSITVLLIVFHNNLESKKELKQILNAVIYVMIFAALLGLIGIVGFYRGSFTSGIGYFLPDFITDSSYGQQIAFRHTGGEAWFIGLGQYFRVTSIFLFSTFFATVLAITIPILMYKYKTNSLTKTRKFALIVLVVLLLINLVYTTGRSAMGGLLIGLFYIFLKTGNSITRTIKLILITSFSMGFILFIYFQFGEEISFIIDSILYARGTGSPTSRMGVYTATLEGFMERPFFGWGTERDVPNLIYPAGSHSNYLGTLYKQGLAGFMLVITIYITVWHRLQIHTRKYDLFFSNIIKGIVIIVLINGITDIFDLDATTLLFIWVFIGLGIYYPAKHMVELYKEDD